MMIGIQKGLDGIKNALVNRGYHVMEVNNVHSAPVDVYIYDGHEAETFTEPMNFSIPTMAAMVNPVEQRNYQGTFLINAAHRSAEEIEGMLQRRTYTPLF